jgi:peptidoglycan/xylan/chitin deacetylase (PgdA/CDA1 family)
MMAPIARDPNAPRLGARLSHRLARHVPLSRVAMSGGPLVTFSFDDIPDSAHEEGAAILERHGVKGTFYIAAGLMCTRTPHWHVAGPEAVSDLHARGHEIACHSFAHRRADTVKGAEVDADLARNREALRAIEPSLKLENFAYPFGYGSFRWKRRLRTAFRSSRGILPGVNHGRIDLHFLRAFPLTNAELNPARIDAIMDETERTKGWTIFYSHDVTPQPSIYGCTPALLTRAVLAAQERGIACVTVAEALNRIVAVKESAWRDEALRLLPQGRLAKDPAHEGP